MKKVLIFANHFITLYAFRRELVQGLVDQGYEVHLSLPPSEENKYFEDMGCTIIPTELNRRGTNPFSDFKLFLNYRSILKKIKPDIVLTYTIKPNTYGGLATRLQRIKTLHTVTGLGSVYIQNMWQRKVAVILNRMAFKNSNKIYFLNDHNRDYYRNLKIINSEQDTSIVPGSGVNLNNFKYIKQTNFDEIKFTFVGRILRDKGIEEYLNAAEEIKSKCNNVFFQVVGFVDEEKYISLLKKYEDKGVISYLGKREDIADIMAASTCIVLPSYGEGRGTVLQEGAAIGRPLITCDTYGCRDNVDEGLNGYLCEVGDSKSLQEAMERFLKLEDADKIKMGIESRKKAEREFDRNIVLKEYFNDIKKITNEEEGILYENVSKIN